jgi:hypothetical protein
VATRICVLGFQRSGKHLDTLEKELLDPLSLFLDLALKILLVETVLKDERALFEGADHSGLELAQGDRLQQEISGAQVETLDGGGGFAHATQHDDGAVGEPVTHRFEEAHSVELRHPHVRDDQRGLTDLIEDLKSLSPAAGLEAVEALCLQHAGE